MRPEGPGMDLRMPDDASPSAQSPSHGDSAAPMQASVDVWMVNCAAWLRDKVKRSVVWREVECYGENKSVNQ